MAHGPEDRSPTTLTRTSSTGEADRSRLVGMEPTTTDDGADPHPAPGAEGAPDAEGVPGELKMPHFGMAVICFILFLTFLDNTVISATLSDVQSGLHAGVA